MLSGALRQISHRLPHGAEISPLMRKQAPGQDEGVQDGLGGLAVEVLGLGAEGRAAPLRGRRQRQDQEQEHWPAR